MSVLILLNRSDKQIFFVGPKSTTNCHSGSHFGQFIKTVLRKLKNFDFYNVNCESSEFCLCYHVNKHSILYFIYNVL